MANERILLVDDEQGFTSVVQERLENRGLDVSVATNGSEALKMVNESLAYDAIVLDLQMPGIDGIETLRRLLENDPDLQVILLTGHGSVAKSVEAMKKGAVDFLEKPIEIQNLIDKVGEAAVRRATLIEERNVENVMDVLKKYGC